MNFKDANQKAMLELKGLRLPYGKGFDDLRSWRRGRGSWSGAAPISDDQKRFYELMDILEDIFEDVKYWPHEERVFLTKVYEFYCENIEDDFPYNREDACRCLNSCGCRAQSFRF